MEGFEGGKIRQTPKNIFHFGALKYRNKWHINKRGQEALMLCSLEINISVAVFIAWDFLSS